MTVQRVYSSEVWYYSNSNVDEYPLFAIDCIKERRAGENAKYTAIIYSEAIQNHAHSDTSIYEFEFADVLEFVNAIFDIIEKKHHIRTQRSDIEQVTKLVWQL